MFSPFSLEATLRWSKSFPSIYRKGKVESYGREIRSQKLAAAELARVAEYC
jgi:hypothetical protein